MVWFSLQVSPGHVVFCTLHVHWLREECCPDGSVQAEKSVPTSGQWLIHCPQGVCEQGVHAATVGSVVVVVVSLIMTLTTPDVGGSAAHWRSTTAVNRRSRSRLVNGMAHWWSQIDGEVG
jgi:hypothetical protein